MHSCGREGENRWKERERPKKPKKPRTLKTLQKTTYTFAFNYISLAWPFGPDLPSLPALALRQRLPVTMAKSFISRAAKSHRARAQGRRAPSGQGATRRQAPRGQGKEAVHNCGACGEAGHRADACPHKPNEAGRASGASRAGSSTDMPWHAPDYCPPPPDGAVLPTRTHKGKLAEVDQVSYPDLLAMSREDTAAYVRAAGVVPGKEGRTCWRCGGELAWKASQRRFRCRKSPASHSLSEYAFSPLFSTSVDDATFLRVAYCVGLNLPLGAITHLVGDTLKRVEAVHTKIREACAWKELLRAKDFVGGTGEVEMDAFSTRCSRASSATSNVHQDRHLIVVDRASRSRALFPLGSAGVPKGAAPPPESLAEVRPVVEQVCHAESVLMTDGAQAYKSVARAAGVHHEAVVHSRGQYSRFAKIPSDGLAPGLQALANARETATVLRRPAGRPVLKRPAGVRKRPASLRMRASSNMAEGHVGVLKTHLRMAGLLGRQGREEHLSTLAGSFNARSPGLDPVIQAVSDFVDYFKDICDPDKFWLHALWRLEVVRAVDAPAALEDS